MPTDGELALIRSLRRRNLVNHLFLGLWALFYSLVDINHFVEEGLVEGLAAQCAAEKLNVEATFVKGLVELVCGDGLILVEAALARHLLLEHLGEELSRLVRLGQAHTSHELFK